MVGGSQLAAVLEAEYCPVEQTEPDIGGLSETEVFKPSSVSEPVHRVISQQTDTHESMRK